MKCPHCEYEDGWSGEKLQSIEGNEGEFYTLPVSLERADTSSYYRSVDRVTLFACPSCRKTFIED